MAINKSQMLLLGMMCTVALTLGACREGEQGRVLSFEPGKFLGKNPDTELSANQKRDLRNRANYQSGATAPVGGGSSSDSTAMSRKQLQALKLRAQSQSGSK